MDISSVHIINGPNLNLLGVREPEIYGNTSFDEYFLKLKGDFAGVQLSNAQTNHEGQIIDWLHDWGFKSNTGIILNAGAYTHTSIAIRDAIASIENPVVEVHISAVSEREDFRKINYLREVSAHSIEGAGMEGYALAVNWLLNLPD